MKSALAIWLLIPSAFAAETKTLRAGVSEVDITPRKLPVILSGGFLSRSVNEINGPLRVRALVLDDSTTRIVVAIADTLMMPRELLDEVKLAASRTTGIPPSRMLISATHTHSAPPVMGALGTDAQQEYAALLRGKLVEVIESAAARTTPARIGWAVVPVPELTHCRRWILRPDKMRKDPFGNLTIRANMHPGYQNPDFIGPAGPSDPALSLLAVETAEGKPLAVLANYSMHYVGSDRGVSPDYYGPFSANMRRLLGVSESDPGFTAMMSQGTSGDQHWMDYSKPKQEMTSAQYAGALSQKVHEAYRKIQFHTWVPVGIAETTLTLARRAPDAARLKWAREIYDKMPGGIPRDQVEVYAREQILLDREPRRELILQAARIGGLGIAAWPNEVFAISGLKVKAQSPLPPTFNIELANGADGYIPPPEQHLLGGYTTWPARTAALEIGAEPRIVETLLDLLEKVSSKKRRSLAEAPGDYAKAVLASRPAAYWRGEDISGTRARDSSRYQRHGEYTGGVALYLDGPGQASHAPHYAGGHMKAALPFPARDYSVSLWFWNGLASRERPAPAAVFSWGVDTLAIGGTARLMFRAGGQTLEGRTALATNTWHFAVVNRDSLGVRIYLNGATVPEVSGALPQPTKPGEFRLAAGSGDDATFEGRIAEAAVFPRALSDDEIAALYRSAKMKM